MQTDNFHLLFKKYTINLFPQKNLFFHSNNLYDNTDYLWDPVTYDKILHTENCFYTVYFIWRTPKLFQCVVKMTDKVFWVDESLILFPAMVMD